MEEIMGARFADDSAPAAAEAPKAEEPAAKAEPEAKAEESAPVEDPGSEEGSESKEGEPEEKPKAWKKDGKGPPETVPYKVLSERTAQFRQREAELLARLEAAEAGKVVPSEQQQVAPAPQGLPEQGFTPEDLGMPPEPSMDKFDTLADYERAVRQWDREFAKREALAEMQAGRQAETQQQVMDKVVQTFEERLDQARQADPEIAEIEAFLQPAAPYLHPMIRQALLESSDPAAMLRHIAEYGSGFAGDQEAALRAIVHRCNSNPVGILMELGRISSAAQREPASSRQAPPPIPPTRTVGGGRGLKNTDPVESVLSRMGTRFAD